ncbi:TPA: ATP synthase F1 subunit epsilon [Patescibacteria group bacterium]|uniref:ATP synthase epsilon chain n=1 Tax=Candidatus Gottesmanbacteria bacterium GW2011_GWA1_43_11 TaxID=1618436 RepID=A0A0G1FD25_9BACT|nr:MAG: ATP synthase epsilon chain [Candidatus Gottesmanbacteria bacterium GW2011_GWA1_43_11]HCS79515.1 ATP synthase F1 subunit epsilon [Patescibacteria group bacterium]
MLQLEIVTPDRIAFSKQVDMVVVPSTRGAMGILPRHITLFAQLVEGELKIKIGNDEYYLAIGGGFIEVTKTKVIVLVTRAVNAGELNEQVILTAKAKALAALHERPTGESLAAAQLSLRQTIVDLRILNKRKRRTH